MELNLNGLEEYRRDKKAYLTKVKELCYMNKIPVTWEEDEDRVLLFLSNGKQNKGVLLTNYDKFDYPCFTDGEDLFDFLNDCPTPEEVLYRYWNLKHIIDFGDSYSLEKILDKARIERERYLMNLNIDMNVVENFEETIEFKNLGSSEKFCLILANSFFNLITGEDIEMKDDLKAYLIENYEEGSPKKNCNTISDWLRDLQETCYSSFNSPNEILNNIEETEEDITKEDIDTTNDDVNEDEVFEL